MREGFPETLRIILEPIVHYLDDPAVTTIFVNGADEVWVERDGVLVRGEPKGRFTEGILLDAVRAAARAAGGGLSGEATRLDARLAGGARITAILPPVARKGPCLVLRKGEASTMSLADLVAAGSVTTHARRFFEACVGARRNIVVWGLHSSGRTTVLSAIASLAPATDRIVVLEASREMRLEAAHVVPLELQADHAVELIDALPMMRVDLVVVGELDGAQALPLLRLMSGGLAVLTCVTAGSPSDALLRLEAMCHLAGKDLSPRAVRGLVGAGVDLLVGTARFPDGARRVISIAECKPVGADGEYRVVELFRASRPTAVGEPRPLEPCGVEPEMAADLRAAGFLDLKPSFFGVGVVATSRHEEKREAAIVARAVGAAAGTDAELDGDDSEEPPPAAALVRSSTPAPARAPAPAAAASSVATAAAATPAAVADADDVPPPPSSSRRRGIGAKTMLLSDQEVGPLEGQSHNAPDGAASMASPGASSMIDAAPASPPPDDGPIDAEPGVVMGGAAGGARWSRPLAAAARSYAIEGATGGFGEASPVHRERTVPGPGAPPKAGTEPALDALAPAPPASESTAVPEGSGPKVAAGLLSRAAVATPGETSRSARATLAIEAPVLRRRDGEAPASARPSDRSGPPPPRVVAASPASRAHLAGTKEYPALRLGEDGPTWEDPAAKAHAIEVDGEDIELELDDEGLRELNADRRRRTTDSDDDVDLESPAESRIEDTNPHAVLPESPEE